MKNTVFITIGTTKFDELIKELDQQEFIDILKKNAIQKLIIQIGKGEYYPKYLQENCLENQIDIEIYRFKPTLDQDIDKCNSLLISHAGAGSILEGLRKEKNIFVVVNENLMDNHQLELAEALGNENYLSYSLVSNFYETLQAMNFNNLNFDPYPPKKESLFGNLVNELML